MSTRLGSTTSSWNGDHRHEGAMDAESEDSEDIFREFRNVYEMDKQPARAERVRVERRKTVRQTRGLSCVNGLLVKKPWLVRPRQPRVA